MARVGRIAKNLLAVHVELAQAEAARDAARVARGGTLMVVGAALLGVMLLMVNAAAVAALHEREVLPLSASILLVAGVDLLLGLLALSAGRRRLGGPILEETRGLVKKTVSAITDG